MRDAPDRRLALNAPVQKRSKETLSRILAAARSALEKKTLEELTVAEIAARGDFSVGSFYERFGSKDALLPHLLELHYAEIENELGGLIARTRDESDALRSRVTTVVQWLVDTARRQRGLIRALVLRNYRQPDLIPDTIHEAAARILEMVHGFLGECEDETGHPQPRLALEVGLHMVMATIRERVVLGGTPQVVALSLTDEQLTTELADALYRYLAGDLGVDTREVTS